MRRWLLLAACAVAACGPRAGAPLVADDVRITAPRPGTSMSAGYLSLSNPGGGDVEITRVTSPQFEAVELHRTVLEDGIARMRAEPAIVVAAGATVRFAPGGLHLMLMRPRGDARRATLEFWSGETLVLAVEAPVE